MDFYEWDMINAINLLQPDCYVQFNEAVFVSRFPNPEIWTIKRDLLSRQSDGMKLLIKHILCNPKNLFDGRGFVKVKELRWILRDRFGWGLYSRKTNKILQELKTFLEEMKI